jgi:hypothetical protein
VTPVTPVTPASPASSDAMEEDKPHSELPHSPHSPHSQPQPHTSTPPPLPLQSDSPVEEIGDDDLLVDSSSQSSAPEVNLQPGQSGLQLLNQIGKCCECVC